jgi:hypothetical protein
MMDDVPRDSWNLFSLVCPRRIMSYPTICQALLALPHSSTTPCHQGCPVRSVSRRLSHTPPLPLTFGQQPLGEPGRWRRSFRTSCPQDRTLIHWGSGDGQGLLPALPSSLLVSPFTPQWCHIDAISYVAPLCMSITSFSFLSMEAPLPRLETNLPFADFGRCLGARHFVVAWLFATLGVSLPSPL